MKDLIFDDVPRNWAICFQTDCPLAVKCLRYHAATLAPATLTQHTTVLPATRTDAGCSLFVADEPVVVARGMTRIFDGVKSWDVPRLRNALEACFGSRAQYYRYRSGRYDITPAQQARVAEIFRKNGYAQPPVFDQTSVRYYFNT